PRLANEVTVPCTDDQTYWQVRTTNYFVDIEQEAIAQAPDNTHRYVVRFYHQVDSQGASPPLCWEPVSQALPFTTTTVEYKEAMLPDPENPQGPDVAGAILVVETTGVGGDRYEYRYVNGHWELI